MGLLDKLRGQQGSRWAITKPEPKPVAETPQKRDLGVCIPNHAKDADERKKMLKNEVSPFERLQNEHQKDDNFKLQFSRAKEKKFDSQNDLGIESAASAEKQEEVNEVVAQAVVEEKEDELDVAARQMDSFVPKFSRTARQKLGIESKPEAVRHETTGSFEVSGVYPGSETMISGRVVSGKIKKPMNCTFGKVTLRISDIKKGSLSASELCEGQSGTIFVRGSAAYLRNGDVLDFY